MSVAAGLEGEVWQYFVTVPDFRATGVRDGVRAFEWPAIIHPRREHRGRHDRRSPRVGLGPAEEDHRPHFGRGAGDLPRVLRPDAEAYRDY